MGQSNQVHQLQLLQKITLMKNCEFCEDMSNKKMQIVYHLSYTYTKMSFFILCFCVDWCEILANDRQEIKISIRMTKFHFLVKYAVFIKNENEFFFKNCDLMTIFNKCFKFRTILSKKNKTPPKTSIPQRLQTDLGRSVGVTITNQMVWLNRFMGSQPSH